MRRAAVLAALAVVAVSCGSGGTSESSGTEAPAAAPTGDAATTTTPVAPTTAAPTAAPATTAPEPTSTSAAPPAGWTAIDPTTIDAPLGIPCCASNWFGDPSPPLPADGEPLADGAYRVELDWPADPSGSVVATLHRFERCADLPEGSCEEELPEYAPDSLGIDESDEYPLTVSFDDDQRVILTGFNGFDNGSATAEATGSDLAELIRAVDADYAAAIGDRVLAGEDGLAVFNEVNANPQHGFTPAEEHGTGGLSYVHGDAPPLLFQGPVNLLYDDTSAGGSRVLVPVSVIVKDGQPTPILFAGFYS